MRLLKITLLALALSAGVAHVNAIPFSDLDTINQRLTAGGSASTYSGTFNILDDGFVPGTHQVWGAAIYFKLADDGDREGETYSINLDNTVTSTHFTGFLLLSGVGVGINLLASLNADGVLNYSVTATSGDFWLRSALLIAEADTVKSVPEGGATIVMMGAGLLVIGFLARRKMSAKSLRFARF